MKMAGSELQTIRHRLGLTTTALGRAFGYEGSDVTASGTIRKYESDARPIPPWLARLATMYDVHGVPEGWMEKPVPVITAKPDDIIKTDPQDKYYWSLGKRVLSIMKKDGPGLPWFYDCMSHERQTEIFGTVVTGEKTMITVIYDIGGRIGVEWRDPDRGEQRLTLRELQRRLDRADDQDDDFLQDGLTIDFRTRFPEGTMAIATVSNPKTYQSEDVFATSDEHALLQYARDEGYATWAELRSAALPGDREEDWVVTWQEGRPDKPIGG